jgi:hypothetical protein
MTERIKTAAIASIGAAACAVAVAWIENYQAALSESVATRNTNDVLAGMRRVATATCR